MTQPDVGRASPAPTDARQALELCVEAMDGGHLPGNTELGDRAYEAAKAALRAAPPAEPRVVAEKLAALIPQMEEDARIHRAWETPAAQADMVKPSEKPLAEWVGDAAWHNRWADFYERATATMTEAVALLRGAGRPEPSELYDVLDEVRRSGVLFERPHLENKVIAALAAARRGAGRGPAQGEAAKETAK